jgi:circadian clock protein KaiC
MGPGGLTVGEPLRDFEGVLGGLPTYRGATPLMQDEPLAGET